VTRWRARAVGRVGRVICVALLRGINVGGRNKVEMARLKLTFERLGLTGVVTYINSGNVVFRCETRPLAELAAALEAAIAADFGLSVPVVLRERASIEALCAAVPPSWVDSATMRTYVMFLWDSHDRADVLDPFPVRPELETVRYVGGAIVWNIGRRDLGHSGLAKLTASPLYPYLTIRNINTVRKLAELMSA